MKKKLIIASGLVVALSAATVYAERGGGGCEHGFGKEGHGFGMMGHHNRAEMMAREFNADQIRTLMAARLIMKGNDNLKVGKISSSRTGFTVAIVTKDDSLVEELELAKNGMPLQMYEHIQERIEKRKEKEVKN